MKATSEYFSSKKEEANKEFRYFKGVDENCKAFNDKNMFDLEQVNSFSGFKGEDRLTNFSNAGGCNYSFSAMQGSMNMRNAAGGKNCQDGTHCGIMEFCRNGECVPDPRFPDGNNRTTGGASRRASANRVSVNPVGGVARKRRPKAGTPVAVAAKQIGGGRECTAPLVYCKSGDYLGCHPEHKCNGGLRQEKRKTRKSNFAAATRVFPEGQGNYFNGAASSKCGLDR